MATVEYRSKCILHFRCTLSALSCFCVRQNRHINLYWIVPVLPMAAIVSLCVSFVHFVLALMPSQSINDSHTTIYLSNKFLDVNVNRLARFICISMACTRTPTQSHWIHYYYMNIARVYNQSAPEYFGLNRKKRGTATRHRSFCVWLSHTRYSRWFRLTFFRTDIFSHTSWVKIDIFCRSWWLIPYNKCIFYGFFSNDLYEKKITHQLRVQKKLQFRQYMYNCRWYMATHAYKIKWYPMNCFHSHLQLICSFWGGGRRKRGWKKNIDVNSQINPFQTNRFAYCERFNSIWLDIQIYECSESKSNFYK